MGCLKFISEVAVPSGVAGIVRGGRTIAGQCHVIIVLQLQYVAIGRCGKRPIYSRDMSRIVRSAMLQMRVSPEIKLASEHVLRRIGLNITEATELFLRRMIIDQRIPFEVIAVDNATYAQLVSDWEEETRMMEVKRRSGSPKSLVKARVGSKRE